MDSITTIIYHGKEPSIESSIPSTVRPITVNSIKSVSFKKNNDDEASDVLEHESVHTVDSESMTSMTTLATTESEN